MPETIDFMRLTQQQNAIAGVRRLTVDSPQTYFIHTYGCQMNVHDSERLSGLLEEMGYTAASNSEEADLLILNTCCVREHAENKVFAQLGTLAKLKQQGRNFTLCICGCMTQQSKLAKRIAHRFPEVDVVFGTHNTHRFPELLYTALTEHRQMVDIAEEANRVVENLPSHRDGAVSAWTTIMYGCNNFCSYCIVPYVRGRERSRTPEQIIQEAQELTQSGVREITLLGQNVNSYGKDLENINFASLLRRLEEEVPELQRIRFMTSHPKDLSDELIETMAEGKKICKQLHLPVQSGSDAILKAMARRYTRVDYLRLCDKIRSAMPEIGLTTDFIVGFPGESDDDFQDTIALLEEVRFASSYCFKYSRRSGTPASTMPNQISEAVKKERLAELIAKQKNITDAILETYPGKVMPVLVEGLSPRGEGRVTGRTDCGKTVNFKGDADCIGKIVNVKISECLSNTLLGISD